ncbi:RNA polymerase sigma-70 factor (ECF subfamily) [Sphingomonas zeicaulis]|uniref:RNA polymerase sigma factor n=1 Tax=Sphingomonas zeicaulis TaxID=1632740 RepID=UPI003D23D735
MSGKPEDGAHRAGATLLDTLFRTEAPRLRRYFSRRLRGGDEAGDLVQEAFVRFADAAREKLPSRPAAYLQRIATNLLIDRARRVPMLLDPDIDVASAPGQEDALLVDGVMRVYRTALDALPERTRTIFLLYRVEGLVYREIAERMGISIPAVQKHMARALEHLARALADEG